MAEALLLKSGGGVMSAELTAKKSHVLEGYTAVTSDSDDDATEGTMKNRGALNWNESNTTKTVDAGYYSGGTLDSRPSYNKGIAEADGRVNTDSESYKKGYSNGYNAGVADGKQAVKNSPNDYGMIDASKLRVSSVVTNNQWGTFTASEDCIVIISGNAEAGSCGAHATTPGGCPDGSWDTGTETNISTDGVVISANNLKRKAGAQPFAINARLKKGQHVYVSGRTWGNQSNNNGTVSWSYSVIYLT